MAPQVGNKGKGKLQSSRDSRRSRSRNTTPTSTISASMSTGTAVDNSTPTYPPYLQTPLNPAASLSDTAVEDIVNAALGSSASASSSSISAAASNPPSATALNSIAETTRSQLLNILVQRGETCERLLRELAVKRKERIERDRVRERDRDRERERERERDRDKIKTEGEDTKRNGNGHNSKQKRGLATPKRKERDSSRQPPEGAEGESKRPMAVGAHGVTNQDGGDITKAESSSSISSPASHPSPSAVDTSTVKKQKKEKDQTPPSPTTTASPHQPPPAPPVQQFQIFGEDPSSYPDPTVYDIREVTPDMTEDEIKQIYSVASYPESDLHDLTCGTPPDKDYSSARPTNQIAANTFANFVEPYIRPLTEEDKAFLLERGDREKAFVMPKRGTRHYKDIWKEEDEGIVLDPMPEPEPRNEARGDMELMNDDVAESEEVSVGPVLSRLLSMLRYQGPENGAAEEDSMMNGMNGITEMEIDGVEPSQTQPNGQQDQIDRQPPATLMPDWKNAPQIPKTDYTAMDERILQELRYMGFLSSTEVPDFDTEQDDEVAARLRYLQAELRRVSIMNGARKARLLDLTTEYVAAQEWAGIADDLDTQMNQAYLKRNRNISKKGNKFKKSGGAAAQSGASGAAGSSSSGAANSTATNTLGEPIRILMERREHWQSWLGPLVNYGQSRIPERSVFAKDVMERYVAKEQENWGEVDEG